MKSGKLLTKPLMKSEKFEPDHLAYIDTVRGLAFLGVLSLHAALSVGHFFGDNLFHSGGYGVQLFFLASAITLCYSMAARQTIDAYPALFFYLRRFFRIAPMFWLAIIFYSSCTKVMPAFWLSQFAPPGGLPPASYYYITAFFLHGWHPYTFNSIVPGGWSIAVEMTFYIIFPILFYFLNSFKKAVLAVLLGLIFTKLEAHFLWQFRDGLYPGIPGSIFGFFRGLWFPSQLYVFLIGIAVYHLLKLGYTGFLTKSRLGCICLLCWSVLDFSGLLNINVTFTILTLAGLIIALSGQVFSKLIKPWICYIGKISYSCYLVHFFALGTILKLLGISLSAVSPNYDAGGPIANLFLFIEIIVLALLLTVAVSTATLYLVEKPGIKLGKYVIRWISRDCSKKQTSVI